MLGYFELYGIFFHLYFHPASGIPPYIFHLFPSSYWVPKNDYGNTHKSYDLYLEHGNNDESHGGFYRQMGVPILDGNRWKYIYIYKYMEGSQ